MNSKLFLFILFICFANPLHLNAQKKSVAKKSVSTKSKSVVKEKQKLSSDVYLDYIIRMKNGDMNPLQEMISKGYDLNPPTEEIPGILNTLIYLNVNPDHIEKAISAGADVNHESVSGLTPLMYGFGSKNSNAKESIKKILAAPNLDVNKDILTDGLVISTLSVALINSPLNVIKELVTRGANVNGLIQYKSEECSVLTFAEISNVSSDIIIFLESKGAQRYSNAPQSVGKSVTLGDIFRLFGSSGSKIGETSSQAPAKKSEPDCEGLALSDYQKMDKSKIKYEKWKKDNSLFANDDAQEIEFPGNYYGRIFKGSSSKEYFLDFGFGSSTYYDSYDSVVRALYIYKKCQKATKLGKK